MWDLNSRSGLSDRINFLIDAALKERAANKEVRDYLGCSVIGEDCERSVQYEALCIVGNRAATQAHVEALAPATLRKFQRGDWAESVSTAWLRAAGYCLATIDPKTNTQFEVKFLDGLLCGHADGILFHFLGNGPNPFPLPALWECKCLAHKWVMALKRNGLKATYPKYYAQMQLYMCGLKLDRGLLTVVDADSMELYHTLVDYDQQCVDQMLARCERIFNAIKAGEMLPRGRSSRATLVCKFCNYADLCWGSVKDAELK